MKEKTLTHRIEAEEAPALFERINRGAKDVLGAVMIHWAEEKERG